MGISRSSVTKRRLTGGKVNKWRKKRNYELGRPAAQTKLSSNKTVRLIRTRGGNVKLRALRLDQGNFSWQTEACTRKARILDVSYNASNNELVRTKTLVKGAIIQIDAAPFKTWYNTHYGVDLSIKKGRQQPQDSEDEKKKSNSVMKKIKARNENRSIDQHLVEQFQGGRLYAKIASRPGQCGRCDGYILEGKELDFYLRKMQKKGHK